MRDLLTKSRHKEKKMSLIRMQNFKQVSKVRLE